MPYKIKSNVIFRIEMNNLIVLSPISKKLFVFKDEIFSLINADGCFREKVYNESEMKIIGLFEKEGVI